MNKLASLALAASLSVAIPATAATVVVEVDDNSFNPPDVTICLGDTVEWQWVGNIDHSVTSGDGCGGENGAFDSGVLSTGATYSYVFSSIPIECASDDTAGDNTCSYFCIPHCAMMQGSVTVVEPPAAALGISKSSLVASNDGMQGRRGNVSGVEMLDGAVFEDVVVGSSDLTLTLNAPGLGTPVFEMVTLVDERGNYVARLPRNESLDVNVRLVKIVPGRDPDVAKVLVKYETNNFNLNTVGPLTVTVDISRTVDTPCGPEAVVATDSAPVQL